MDKFSVAVTEKLKSKPMSIPDFAKKMNLSASHIYSLLSGAKRWNEDTMSKACEILEIAVEFKIED